MYTIAITVATAMRYLGPDRERDAELLADFMMAHVENISAAAGGVLMPSAVFPDSERIMAELGEQMRTHSEELCHTAQHALADMFWRALHVAILGPPASDERLT
jgi:hypothetical protein